MAGLSSSNAWTNAAWLAMSVMAHNLGRAVRRLAGADLENATARTLQPRVSTVPGRMVTSGRRRHLRLPASWPWAPAIEPALSGSEPAPLLTITPHPNGHDAASTPEGLSFSALRASCERFLEESRAVTAPNVHDRETVTMSYATLLSAPTDTQFNS